MTAAHSAKRAPEPILTRAGIVTAITVLAAVLVHVGAGNVSVWLFEHRDQIAGGLLAVGPTVTAVLARRHTRPIVETGPLIEATGITAANMHTDAVEPISATSALAALALAAAHAVDAQLDLAAATDDLGDQVAGEPPAPTE